MLFISGSAGDVLIEIPEELKRKIRLRKIAGGGVLEIAESMDKWIAKASVISSDTHPSFYSKTAPFSICIRHPNEYPTPLPLWSLQRPSLSVISEMRTTSADASKTQGIPK